MALVLFQALTAMAASTRDGKRKFRKYCYKKCHNGDKAELIEPTIKTKEQWIALFNNNHEGLKEAHPNGELEQIKKLKTKHYENIKRFLIKHSADSEQPETCG
jgi:hypothetical protein